MVDYREILRLASLKYSQRMIESSAGSSRHTINAVLTAAKNAGITWPLDENVTNAMFQATFFPGKYTSTSKYAEPDYSTIHRELVRPGVILTLLWAEYCRKGLSRPRTVYPKPNSAKDRAAPSVGRVHRPQRGYPTLRRWQSALPVAKRDH